MNKRRAAGAVVRSTAVLGGSLLVILLLAQGIGRPIRWEIPEGYRGWVLVRLSEPSCAPMRADGIFEVITVDVSGMACTSSDLPRGWRYVRYESVGPSGRLEIDRSLVSHETSSYDGRRATRYIGPPATADFRDLPPGWR